MKRHMARKEIWQFFFVINGVKIVVQAAILLLVVVIYILRVLWSTTPPPHLFNFCEERQLDKLHKKQRITICGVLFVSLYFVLLVMWW